LFDLLQDLSIYIYNCVFYIRKRHFSFTGTFKTRDNFTALVQLIFNRFKKAMKMLSLFSCSIFLYFGPPASGFPPKILSHFAGHIARAGIFFENGTDVPALLGYRTTFREQAPDSRPIS